MKKVSVIIPHYNSKISLEVLLNSIPDEDWIETLVVDDNSDFDIYDLAEDYSSVRFLRVDRKKKGAGAARNLGLIQATGSYVIFADADDYFTDSAFDILKKYVSKNQEVTYFKSTSIYLNSGKTAKRHLASCSLIEDFLKHKQKEIFFKFYEPVCKLICMSFIRNHDIRFEEIIASNDILFSLNVAYYSSIIMVCNEEIYVITDTKNSLTKQKSEIILDCRFEAMVRYNEFLKSKGLHEYQGAMFMHLWKIKQYGFKKVLKRHAYCKQKKYPIFPNRKHTWRILRNLLHKTGKSIITC